MKRLMAFCLLTFAFCLLPTLAWAQSPPKEETPLEAKKLSPVQQRRLTEIDTQINEAKKALEAASKRLEATRQRSEASAETVQVAELQARVAHAEHAALVKWFDFTVLQAFIEWELDPDKYEQKLSVIDLANNIGFAVKTEATRPVQTSVTPKKE